MIQKRRGALCLLFTLHLGSSQIPLQRMVMKESDTQGGKAAPQPRKVLKAKAQIRPPSRDSHFKGQGPSTSPGT